MFSFICYSKINDQLIGEITSCFKYLKCVFFHKTQICYKSSLKERASTYFWTIRVIQWCYDIMIKSCVDTIQLTMLELDNNVD